jgi:hypothetical protein
VAAGSFERPGGKKRRTASPPSSLRMKSDQRTASMPLVESARAIAAAKPLTAEYTSLSEAAAEAEQRLRRGSRPARRLGRCVRSDQRRRPDVAGAEARRGSQITEISCKIRVLFFLSALDSREAGRWPTSTFHSEVIAVCCRWPVILIDPLGRRTASAAADVS